MQYLLFVSCRGDRRKLGVRVFEFVDFIVGNYLVISLLICKSEFMSTSKMKGKTAYIYAILAHVRVCGI
jgi:hypothetical protein